MALPTRKKGVNVLRRNSPILSINIFPFADFNYTPNGVGVPLSRLSAISMYSVFNSMPR